MRNPSLLILAAGIGRRYRGLKQIDPVGPAGEPLLDYSLYDAHRAGFNRVVFVIRRQIEEAFRRSVGDYWETRMRVAYAYQEIEAALPAGFAVPLRRQKPWGTAHAVLVGRKAIDSPFAVINADDFYGPGAYREIGGWLKQEPQSGGKDEYCFVGYALANTLSEFGAVSRGVCSLDAGGYLSEVVERLKIEKQEEGGRMMDADGRWVSLPGRTIVSLNFWGFTPSVFAHLERGFAAFLGRLGAAESDAEYFIPTAVNELVKSGKVRVKYLSTAEQWFGVTYPEDVPRVRMRIQELVAQGVYPERIRY
jgi:UTP-glucose-1-phosphate uridylyltransferase